MVLQLLKDGHTATAKENDRAPSSVRVGAPLVGV